MAAQQAPPRRADPLAALLLICVLGCSEPSSQAGFLLTRGISEMSNGDYALADILLEHALETDSTLVAGWYYRGLSFAEQSQLNEADSCFARALSLKAVHFPTLLARGRMRLDRWDIAGAMSDFAELSFLYPKLSQGYEGRASVFEELGCDGEAIDELGFAIRWSPGNPALHEQRGVAFLRMGMADSAMADFTCALAFDPSLPRAHAGRGEAQYLLGFHQLAMADCDTALLLDKDNAGAWLVKARAAESALQPDVAGACYRRFLELVPKSDPAVPWVKSRLRGPGGY